jgi:hypothetical protein
LVTELAESGAGDEVIMSIAGHVSRAMLSRYSHVRMEAKRRALDEIAARQCAADEKNRDLVPDASPYGDGKKHAGVDGIAKEIPPVLVGDVNAIRVEPCRGPWVHHGEPEAAVLKTP